MRHVASLPRLLVPPSGKVVVNPLVVVIHGDRQHLLGSLLADDVLVQVGVDLLWGRRRLSLINFSRLDLFCFLNLF